MDAIERSGNAQGYSHAMLALMYAGLGEKELAFKEGNVALTLEGKDTLLVPAVEEILAQLEARFGDENGALERLAQLLKKNYHSWAYISPLTPALLRLDPIWDSLRHHPQFQALLGPNRP